MFITTITSNRPVQITAVADVNGKNLIAAIHGGEVTFGKVRESGSVRNWPVYAPGTANRAIAEKVQEERAAKREIASIAKSLNLSVATVRRHITALTFTLELESMKSAERVEMAKGIHSEWKASSAEAPAEKKAEAPKAEKPAKAPKVKKEETPKPAPKAAPKKSLPAKANMATMKARLVEYGVFKKEDAANLTPAEVKAHYSNLLEGYAAHEALLAEGK